MPHHMPRHMPCHMPHHMPRHMPRQIALSVYLPSISPRPLPPVGFTCAPDNYAFIDSTNATGKLLKTISGVSTYAACLALCDENASCMCVRACGRARGMCLCAWGACVCERVCVCVCVCVRGMCAW